MPVLISAIRADVEIVRGVAAGLRESGGEVRCYLEEDDHELREIGCKVAVGELDDEDRLEAALTNVHTFMPLLPDLLTIAEDPAAALALGRSAPGAAARSGIAQTILGITGCRPPGSEVSQMLDDIEATLSSEADPVCIIRTGVIVGGERPASNLPWPETTALAVDLEFLARVLVAADDREGTSGTWELGGTPHKARPPAGGPPDFQRMEAWLAAALASAPQSNSAADQFGIPLAESHQ